MSFDGSSHAATLAGVNPRTVTYIGVFPHLLLSLHPDYVMTHRLVPLSPGRTFVECQWLFAAPDVDPAYAVEFWDRTNQQDWAAVESVQRGLASPAPSPGTVGAERERDLRLGHHARTRLRGRAPDPARAGILARVTGTASAPRPR